jgi:transcription elongation factor Elf1
MVSANANETTARCPKCGAHMSLAATIPHTLDAQMARHTYLCSQCNQTRTYMLPTK